jgi:multidrug efflux pump subunit AcrA (membrane-fusion protein)
VKVMLENRIINGHPVLRGGMLARAWLPVGKTGLATIVPKDALVLGTGDPLVFVVDPPPSPAPAGTGVVRPVRVSLGATMGGSVEIMSPIELGSLVVIRGNERLRPGMNVSFSAVP